MTRLPSQLSRLTCLTLLDVGKNCLECLPTTLAALDKLEVLNTGGNPRLRSFSFESSVVCETRGWLQKIDLVYGRPARAAAWTFLCIWSLCRESHVHSLPKSVIRSICLSILSSKDEDSFVWYPRIGGGTSLDETHASVELVKCNVRLLTAQRQLKFS